MNTPFHKRTLMVSLVVCSMIKPTIGATIKASNIVSTKEHTTYTTQDEKINIKGQVVDSKGTPITGARVTIMGSKSGTITDINGQFTLKATKGDILEVSYIGFKSVQKTLNTTAPLKIILQEESKSLNEIVVTALGVKKDKKALGYAIQEIKGEDIVASRESNLANALTGKISGLEITKSSNGPGGSSKITIRGNNSISGLNQPLIVVDGVPIDNFVGQSNNDYWNPSPDMGNGLADINQEDIESISVLKGASAAALYGSRAGNGVILITTKSGHRSAGLGVTVSSSISLETIFMQPQRQTAFGQGSRGSYDSNSGSSWGPRIKGQDYDRWDGQKSKMSYYDNINNYFNKPGISYNNNISFQQKFKNLSLYSSLNRMDDMSKIPGADLDRTAFTLRSTSNFGPSDKIILDSKIQYITTTAYNRPLSGNNNSNPFLAMYTLPVSLDIRDLNTPYEKDGKMIWYTKGNGINPYWSRHKQLNRDTRNRFIFFSSLKYNFTDWLNAQLKAGLDQYFTEEESKLYGGSPKSESGFYSFGEEKFYETNYSFLISANKDNLYGAWGGALSFGGNLMHRRMAGVKGGPNELLVKDLFAFNNAKNKVDINKPFSEKKINSIYGTAQINYDGYLYVDATFRNDWSSTLSKANRSFFYPSLSSSFVISDFVNKHGQMPSWFNYAKIRASVAQVGNDLDPYRLYNTYTLGLDPENHTTAELSKTLYDSNVKSELITSYEIGSELRFFENKLSLDFAWYKTNATRQLLMIPQDAMQGFKDKMVNAGNIQNQGIEIMIGARPIEEHDYGWHILANFARNRNTIVELSPEIKDFFTLGGYDNLQVVAKVGGNYGEIYGTTFMRVEDPKSPYYGKMIVDGNGLPNGNADPKKIGDQQSDFTLGITNSFRYKGWALSFLIDGRFGGNIFSATNQLLQKTGVAAITVTNDDRKEFIVDGVYKKEDGTFAPNTTKVTPEDYWNRIGSATGNLGINERNIYSATNIRLRNVQLNYSFAPELLKKVSVQKLKLGISINNVWMLKSHMNGIDPESVFATGTNAIGFEAYAPPTSRTYLFNVSMSF